MSEVHQFVNSGDKVYEFRFTDWGMQMRTQGGAWMVQGITFANIVTLIETKNAAFAKHGGNMLAAQQEWQRETVKRVKDALSGRKRKRA